MKHKAGNLGVDLLLVDTGEWLRRKRISVRLDKLIFSLGDLHDGAGLSDAALPNGVISNPIFDEIDYDVLTIGSQKQIRCKGVHLTIIQAIMNSMSRTLHMSISTISVKYGETSMSIAMSKSSIQKRVNTSTSDLSIAILKHSKV